MDKDKLNKLIKDSIDNNSSFELLLEEYKTTIRYYLNNYYIEGFDKDDLLNIIYTTIYKCCRNYDIDRGVGFKSYLSKSIRNVLIHKIIKIYRSIRPFSLDFKSDEDSLSLLEKIKNSEDSSIDFRDELLYFHKKLYPILSDRQKLVYSFYIKGFRGSELGNQVGLTSKEVDNCICRIKIKGKQIYGEYYKRESNI